MDAVVQFLLVLSYIMFWYNVRIENVSQRFSAKESIYLFLIHPFLDHNVVCEGCWRKWQFQECETGGYLTCNNHCVYCVLTPVNSVHNIKPNVVNGSWVAGMAFLWAAQNWIIPASSQ